MDSEDGERSREKRVTWKTKGKWEGAAGKTERRMEGDHESRHLSQREGRGWQQMEESENWTRGDRATGSQDVSRKDIFSFLLSGSVVLCSHLTEGATAPISFLISISKECAAFRFTLLHWCSVLSFKNNVWQKCHLPVWFSEHYNV